MLAPPTGPRSDITKHILEGHSCRTHVFSFLASVATTPALKYSSHTVYWCWSQVTGLLLVGKNAVFLSCTVMPKNTCKCSKVA